MRILVTGASGFVGQAVVRILSLANEEVVAAVRNETAALSLPQGVKAVLVGDMDDTLVWDEALDGCEAVIHLAARVHVMKEDNPNPLDAFRRVNVAGTAALAQAALKAGVRRFIYLSSIKVNGEATHVVPFSSDDMPAPRDPYARSKAEAEACLDAFEGQGLEVVIVRPPLVYGPGVKGNFLALMNMVHKGIPLPLACVKNARSAVYVENLAHLLLVCLRHEKAAGGVFLACDGSVWSTPQLIRELAQKLGRTPRLFCITPFVLRFLARFVGRAAQMERLLSSLVVDADPLRQVLDWTPPYSAEEGLEKTVAWFLLSLNAGSGP
ncbi:MAG: NAD-dependent epimerase/dehydratase family protein [Proteobacteria bacterium]|nr:NAD-dependent epimerase/dehydratase family protein [Pseudomonadota bacterium]